MHKPTAPREKPTGQSAAQPSGQGSTVLASALGFVVAASVAGAFAWFGGCGKEAPERLTEDHSTRTATPPKVTTAPVVVPSASVHAASPSLEQPKDAGSADAEPDAQVAEEKPYTGPLLGAFALQTPIYPTMEFSKKRLGYIRLGGKVPVDPTPIKATNCQQGWFKLLDGGYVCGKYATTNMSDPKIKLGITSPNLEDVLPYKYAYNTKHGTPLYRSVPSKDEMRKYEPYLDTDKAKKKKKKDAEEKNAADKAAQVKGDAAAGQGGGSSAAPAAPASADVKAEPKPPEMPVDLAAAANGDSDAGVEEAPAKPWWEDHEQGKQLNVTLADLDKDADDTVAKRMVKGFFVAVDKSFGWNGRLWYKTTSGLVAPSDRMYIVKPPTSRGMDVPDGVKQIGFVTSSKASKYEFDADKKKVSVLGPIARFTAFGLTGETFSHKTVIYRKTTEGFWMKAIDGTYTDPGPPPPDLAPGEKWIDVNLSRKTLMAFEGDKPVFAALISPGKKSKNKAKDHSTVQGTFRIREKHLAVTMDGDGTVAGDLPYSIEDVPYVAYFEGSYALHGAFWHNSFGHEMSHGCVNLSPLDAKRIFFWAEPALPRGWHAVWATPEHKGTLVVIHE